MIEKPKKRKRSPKAIMKDKAWAAFSKYIRLKYANEQGYEECYTCGAVKHYKQMQAGHGIGGRNNSVLFMEDVVRPQCAGCNLWGGGKYSIFTEKLIREYGADKYAELVILSNQSVDMNVFDYEALYKKYKDLSDKI